MSAGSDFDWGEIAEAVVIPEQAATAVYPNPQGQIVIRQEGRLGPDEDVWIVVAPEHAQVLAEAILRCAAEITSVAIGNAAQAPRDRTAAERMHRYRAKHRNDRNSTDRNGVLVELPFLPSVDTAGE